MSYTVSAKAPRSPAGWASVKSALAPIPARYHSAAVAVEGMVMSASSEISRGQVWISRKNVGRGFVVAHLLRNNVLTYRFPDGGLAVMPISGFGKWARIHRAQCWCPSETN